MVCSPHQILFGFSGQEKKRRIVDVATMGERRGAYRAFVGKPEGKRPLRRPKRNWQDNIKTSTQEIGCGWRGTLMD